MAVIPQTRFEVLEPGTYRVRVAETGVEDGAFGQQVKIGFLVLDEGLEGLTIKAWCSAKLTGGKRPSKLYGFVSALLFGGRGLPEAFDLDTDVLIGREALAVVEVTTKDAGDFNRIASLLPLRPARAAAAARPGPGPAPGVPAERQLHEPPSRDDDLPF